MEAQAAVATEMEQKAKSAEALAAIHSEQADAIRRLVEARSWGHREADPQRQRRDRRGRAAGRFRGDADGDSARSPGALTLFQLPGRDEVQAIVPGEAMDSGDKAVSKAMSVAFRIALIQALNLPTGEPDADSQSYERSSRDERDQSWRDQPAVNRAQQGNGNGRNGGQPQRPAAPALQPLADLLLRSARRWDTTSHH
jgi:hypothetical protein